MNAASFFRRLIVTVMTLTVAFLYIFVNFRGLTTPDGMEKAQLAREIARGSYKTKFIRPISIWQYSQAKKREAFLKEVARTDSYNSPLYPLVLGAVFKMIGADDYEKWLMTEDDKVYNLDRVIAGLSAFFFLVAALIALALAREMFDSTVAGMTFITLITCEMLWKFTQTGMPNCLMLLLFMAALYCMYKATVNSQEDKGNGFVFGSLAGILLVLLTMCHWMGAWVLVGFIIYSFFFIKPMGGIAGVSAIVAVFAFMFPVIQNMEQTGNPFGTAFYTLYTGLGASDEMIMRSGDSGDIEIPFRSLAMTFSKNAVLQVSKVFEYTGLIVAAPLFFLSLIHRYKKTALMTFGRGVMIMWVFAGLGMSIYGVGEDAFYSNQIHYLFAPVMTIFGLSMVAILWNRLTFGREMDAIFRNAHFYVLGVIAAAPMLLSIPDAVVSGLRIKQSFPNWPPYYPSALNIKLNPIVAEDQYVMSDQPWAVAWYADRNAIWIPHNVQTFKEIEDLARSQTTPISGVHISPSSIGAESFYEGYLSNRNIAGLALDGWAAVVTGGKINVGDFAKSSESSAAVLTNYPYPLALNGALMVYYASERAKIISQ